jgi:hypothetical protein
MPEHDVTIPFGGVRGHIGISLVIEPVIELGWVDKPSVMSVIGWKLCEEELSEVEWKRRYSSLPAIRGI